MHEEFQHLDRLKEKLREYKVSCRGKGEADASIPDAKVYAERKTELALRTFSELLLRIWMYDGDDRSEAELHVKGGSLAPSGAVGAIRFNENLFALLRKNPESSVTFEYFQGEVGEYGEHVGKEGADQLLSFLADVLTIALVGGHGRVYTFVRRSRVVSDTYHDSRFVVSQRQSGGGQ